MAPHFLSYPPTVDSSERSSKNVLIFFISGNPGLIDFYGPFFESLKVLIDSAASLRATRFHIYGQDLAGFGDDEDREPFSSRRKPHDLEDQIQFTFKTLTRLRVSSGLQTGQPYDEVLLVGHSVGAYIALEILHRVCVRQDYDMQRTPYLKLKSGIFLFPTIEHIAQSPSGRRLDLLRRIPVLRSNAHRVVRGFLFLWPRNVLSWVVRRVLKFPPHAAEVATRWLKSRNGVWQSLHMGMDEMRVIGADRWDDELWEMAHETEQNQDQLPPKFYFFFGKDDHWVADRFRDEFIRRRQEKSERTRLIIDEGSIPHAFCIHHSETVAEKVCVWLDEMYGAS